MNPNNTMNWKVMAGLLTVGVVSGSAFTFTKLLANEMGALPLAQGRLTTAAVSVLVVMALQRPRLVVTPKFVARLSVLALLDGVIPYLLISWAAGSVDAAVAGVLISAMPLFTTVMATITLRDESIAAPGLAGIGVGILGVVVLAGPNCLDLSDSSSVGMLAVIAAAASYAAGTVYARVLLRNGDPVTLTGMKLVIASLILAPVTLAGGGASRFLSLSPEGWASLAALGIGATGLGRCLYLWVVKSAGSVRASLVTYITPIVGAFLGWAVLGETIGTDMVGGGALIATGVAIAMYGRRLRLPTLRPTRPTLPAVYGPAREPVLTTDR
jgi:drug/metabolite transporter (DMT)-like permease